MLIKIKSNDIEKIRKRQWYNISCISNNGNNYNNSSDGNTKLYIRRRWNNNEGKPSKIHGRIINISRRTRAI